MPETKPIFLYKKYHSILFASIIVEVVSFVVSLVDSVVAAHMVGIQAFEAIGLVSPFFSAGTFFAAVVNSGTITHFSDEIGRSDKRRAHEYFSQGVLLAGGMGVVFILILLLIRGTFIAGLSVSEVSRSYVEAYFNIIIFYFMLEPISCLLDNIVVSDGGERLSAALNLIQIIGNVILSVLLASRYGVRGIALASVLCKALFVVLILIWFFGKKNTLRFVLCFHIRDALHIFSRGLNRAVTFAMTAIMTYSLNTFIMLHYAEDTLTVWIIVQKLLGLASLYLGLSGAIQPLIGTLRGENNTKAQRLLSRKACFEMLIAGGLSTLLCLIFTPLVLHLFGAPEGDIFSQGLKAVRITSLSLPFIALMVFFFMYYYLDEKALLTVFVSIIKDFASPVLVVFVLASCWKNPDALWVGLFISSLCSAAVCALIVLLRYGTGMFPFLLSKERDERIFIYDFDLTAENAVSMAETASELLKDHGVSPKIRNLVTMLTEDILMLCIKENNAGNKALLAECTLILEDTGVRLITRDSGVILNQAEEAMRLPSFEEYIIENVMMLLDHKYYIVTTGYNRLDMFFPGQMGDKRQGTVLCL